MSLALLVFVVSFLLGSIPFAVIVSKAFKLDDPRNFGSGNPGATNVLRTGNKKAAALTLLGDMIKGFIPVAFCHWVLVDQYQLSENLIAYSLLGAFLGHIYSIFLKFKGGKGVSTSLGVLLGLHPLLAFIVLFIWIAVAFITGYSSLAAIIAAVCAPAIYALGTGSLFGDFNLTTQICLIIMVLVLLYRHKTNIQKLLNGQESGFKKRQK
ncbi:glycerol-3-phosphate 1-O-acyltransferase PlsY [Basilea psittacipulmonis]|uniref:Glycerol-3-phosphate acyltransferase n=1 Tax=Basilea psittacipulmonis DSM 24701 TaxID=1072685 RepID=A0A077DI60_9BURK|nr:glycerol-3-phosphate 1-O-acyltransferase PlsY [Basilea psittacipulmonis]AIL32838.1 hypothetical protein IX83_05480 [Basilea psittacipulmonis DSM 24701]